MAFITKLVLFLLLLCLVVMQDASECNSGHGCCFAKAALQEVQNRKVKEVVFKSSGVHEQITSSGKGGNLFGWDLRKVPSGPDPLHHNGGSPKKPRTP